METRPPLPPFTHETAAQKVRLAEDGWNTRDAAKVALAYTPDTKWRNCAEFANNRAEAQAQSLRQVLPCNASLQNKQDAIEGCLITDSALATTAFA